VLRKNVKVHHELLFSSVKTCAAKAAKNYVWRWVADCWALLVDFGRRPRTRAAAALPWIPFQAAGWAGNVGFDFPARQIHTYVCVGFRGT